MLKVASYLINCNAFFEWLTLYINDSTQFYQGYITSDIAALTLTLSVNKPLNPVWVLTELFMSALMQPMMDVWMLLCAVLWSIPRRNLTRHSKPSNSMNLTTKLKYKKNTTIERWPDIFLVKIVGTERKGVKLHCKIFELFSTIFFYDKLMAG